MKQNLLESFSWFYLSAHSFLQSPFTPNCETRSSSIFIFSLLSLGMLNARCPQGWWVMFENLLSQTRLLFPESQLEKVNLKPTCHLPSEGSRGEFISCLPTFWWPQCWLDCGCDTLTSASMFLSPSLPLQVPHLLFLQGPLPLDLRPTQICWGDFYLKIFISIPSAKTIS